LRNKIIFKFLLSYTWITFSCLSSAVQHTMISYCILLSVVKHAYGLLINIIAQSVKQAS